MSTGATTRKCFSCGFETTGEVRRCPNCNRGLRTAGQIRALGIGMVVIGAGLSGGVAYLIFVMANIMRNTGRGGSSSFTGTPRDAVFIFAILGLVVVIGLASLSTGLYQIIFGRPNRLLSAAVILLGIVTLIVVMLFRIQGQ